MDIIIELMINLKCDSIFLSNLKLYLWIKVTFDMILHNLAYYVFQIYYIVI